MKKLEMKRNKGSVYLLCGLLLITSICVGIASFFTDGDKAENILTVGKNTIEIVEEFDPPEKIEPDISFTKNVTVKNIDGCDCYVRVMAVFTDSSMEQYCEVDWHDAVFANNKKGEYWIYNEEDGYWYYPEAISEGDSTPSLFTTITIKEDAPELELTDFEILVYAESVESLQWQGIESYTQAWECFLESKTN